MLAPFLWHWLAAAQLCLIPEVHFWLRKIGRLHVACSIGKLALRAFQQAVIQAVWTGLSPPNSQTALSSLACLSQKST